MGNKPDYNDLIVLIEAYVYEYGITKTCANILTILANRLNIKTGIIGPMLKEDTELDSIPSGSYGKANPNPVVPEEVLSRNGTETAATPCNLGGLTLILEREYVK